jgi:hypothetical protein
MKLAVLAVAMLAVLATGTSRAASVPRCHTSGLQVSLVGGGAAAGTWQRDIRFRNVSGHTCFVYGYPGLGLENAQHRVLPSNVKWGSTMARRDPRPHHLDLAPGQSVYANMSGTDVPHGNGTCRTYAFLEVTPPDERTHRTVRFGGTACDRGRLTVTALSRTRTPAG